MNRLAQTSFFSYTPLGPIPGRWTVYLRQKRQMYDVCKFFFDSSSRLGGGDAELLFMCLFES